MLFHNKSAILEWTGWILLQQSIAAFGTWSTAQAILAIQHSEEARLWILLTLLGIVLPYIPALLSRYAIKKWEFLLQKRWIDRWLNHLQGRLDLYNDSQKRDTYLGMLQQDGPLLITQLTTTTAELFSALLNFSFQWLVLTCFYSQILGLTLGIGVLISSLMVFAFDPWAKSEAEKTTEASLEMTRLLPGAWEKTIHNNPKSAPLWNTRFTKSFDIFRCQNLKSLRTTLTITGLSLLTMTLPLIATFFFTPQALFSPTMLLLLAAGLPRLLQTVQSAMNALTASLSLRPLLVRIQELQQKLPEIQEPNVTTQGLVQRICPQLLEKIPLNPILLETPGRLTLSARNGSGKSSLLLLLKSMHGSSAYYLPPAGGLPLSDTQPSAPASTGQNHLSQLLAIAKEPPARLLLLDEWDANLDSHHTQILDQHLNRLALKVRIIEVRHQDLDD